MPGLWGVIHFIKQCFLLHFCTTIISQEHLFCSYFERHHQKGAVCDMCRKIRSTVQSPFAKSAVSELRPQTRPVWDWHIYLHWWRWPIFNRCQFHGSCLGYLLLLFPGWLWSQQVKMSSLASTMQARLRPCRHERWRTSSKQPARCRGYLSWYWYNRNRT